MKLLCLNMFVKMRSRRLTPVDQYCLIRVCNCFVREEEEGGEEERVKERREGPSSSKMKPRNVNLDEMSTSE